MCSAKKPYLYKVRQILSQVLKLALVFSTAFMLWKSLCIFANTPSPFIVVISESMEPAFHRGDLLFVWNRDESLEVGEIAVCWLKGRNLPMVHRVVKRFSVLTDTKVNKRYTPRFHQSSQPNAPVLNSHLR